MLSIQNLTKARIDKSSTFLRQDKFSKEKIIFDIHIEKDVKYSKKVLDKKFLEKVARKTLKLAGFNKKAEISLVIVSNKKIKELNRKYRGIDRITDVLSFGKIGKSAFKKPARSIKFIEPPDRIFHLGEIFISYQEAKSQAKENKQTTKKEIALLLSHGILHLLGYEHKKRKEAEKMRAIEKRILSSMNFKF